MPSYTLYYFNGRGRAEVIRMMFGAAGVQFTDKRIEFNEWEKYRNEMPSYCMPVLEIDGKSRMPETMAICRYLAREHEFYGKSNMEMFRNDYICDCLYEIMHDYMRYFHEKNGRFRYRMTSNMGSNMNSNMGSNMDRNMGSNMDRNMGSNMNSNMGSNMNSNMGSKMNSNLDTKMKSDMDSDMSSNTSSGMGFDGSFMQRRFMETSRRVLPFLERTFGMYGGGKQFFMGEQLMMCDMVMYCFLESPMMEFQTMFNSYPKLTSLWKRVGTHPKISTYLKRRVSTNW